MADTKPQIYDTLEILDAGQTTGGTGSTTYSKIDSDQTSIEVNEETVSIDDGQTIINVQDGSFDVLIYDDAVASDSHVQADGTSIPSKAKIILQGATGTDDATMDNIIIRVTPDFGQQRKGFRVRASKRATSNPVSTT